MWLVGADLGRHGEQLAGTLASAYGIDGAHESCACGPQKTLGADREGRQIKTVGIHLQGPASGIPVTEHDSPRRFAGHLQFMNCRAMGVAVDQRPDPVFLHHGRYGFGADGAGVVGFHRRSFETLAAQLARPRVTFRQRHDVFQDCQSEWGSDAGAWARGL